MTSQSTKTDKKILSSSSSSEDMEINLKTKGKKLYYSKKSSSSINNIGDTPMGDAFDPGGNFEKDLTPTSQNRFDFNVNNVNKVKNAKNVKDKKKSTNFNQTNGGDEVNTSAIVVAAGRSAGSPIHDGNNIRHHATFQHEHHDHVDDSSDTSSPASSSCWPLLFERAAPSWWNPRFDSPILEEQYWMSTMLRTTRRFQFGLIYLLLLSLLTSIYFPAMQTPHWALFLCLSLGTLVTVSMTLGVTFSPIYQKHVWKISVALSLVLVCLSLLSTVALQDGEDRSGEKVGVTVSAAGLYAIYLEFLLLLYAVVPLPLYGTLAIGLLYSGLFEMLLCVALPLRVRDVVSVIVNILVHLCIHVIGIHILITTQVRMRDTFMKVAQSLMVKKQLVNEKSIKEKMIHSVMPPKVADWLMNEGHAEDMDDAVFPINGGKNANAAAQPTNSAKTAGLAGKTGEGRKAANGAKDGGAADGGGEEIGEDDDDLFDESEEDSESGSMVKKVSPRTSNPGGDIKSIFRPFNMNAMNDVSILFADIVGFTKMSSNKTASQLVGLLNDLFGRFDFLCTQCGCEKISTLGDCYYCVSGCPEPRPDHAKNCVEMGLSMISAIREFDEDRHESVNMRVGIHTGTVLCGIVGKRRFKFDVWSNDVTLANKMESTGKPGTVHISEKTYAFLKDDYFVQEGSPVGDMKTYFICGRATTNFVPVNTRLARKTSSTPASFLLPALTTTDTSGYVAQSLPSLSPSPQPSNMAMSNSSVVTRNTNYKDVRFKKSSFLSRSMVEKKQKKASSIDEESFSDEILKADGGTLLQHNGANSPVNYDDDAAFDVNDQSKSHNSFAIATRKYAMLATATKDGKVAVSLPEENGDCSETLCRHYSYSLPSLQSSRGGKGAADGHDVLSSAGFSVNNDSYAEQGFGTLAADLEHATVIRMRAGNANQSNHQGATSFFSMKNNHQNNFKNKQRHQNDLAMIRCIKEDDSHHVYFTRPPLNKVTLFFEEAQMERDYKRTAWKLRDAKHSPSLAAAASCETAPSGRAWSSTTFNAYFDLAVSMLSYVIMCIANFFHYTFTLPWLFYFLLASLYQIIVIFVYVSQVQARTRKWKRRHPLRRLYAFCRGWLPSHCFGSLLLALPIGATFANFQCLPTFYHSREREFFLQLIYVGIVHFCNLSALNYCVKSMLATIAAGAVLVLFSPAICPCTIYDASDININGTVIHNDTTTFIEGLFLGGDCHGDILETGLNLTVLVILVWFLNRELEISYRISFHCSLLSVRDRRKIQSLKNQADWLLHNIIPRHVSESLKKSAQYSENHREVGIIFASLVNFNELYDESYMGGKEYLRVLNELISDFDEILDRAEFRNVEKIKTIGSTFMAASGMNPYIRHENTDKYQHLREMLEFVFELQRSVSDFNQSLIEFDLILRIGFNFGDVTAGVIGTTKLYYDIWGDAVNIASRMESTGVEGRIQVSEDSMKILSQWYTFELRGSIFVKGKDNMTTYLVVGRK